MGEKSEIVTNVYDYSFSFRRTCVSAALCVFIELPAIEMEKEREMEQERRRKSAPTLACIRPFVAWRFARLSGGILLHVISLHMNRELGMCRLLPCGLNVRQVIGSCTFYGIKSSTARWIDVICVTVCVWVPAL